MAPACRFQGTDLLVFLTTRGADLQSMAAAPLDLSSLKFTILLIPNKIVSFL